MKQTAVILCILLTLMLTACGGAQQESIVGKWTTSIENDEFLFEFGADGSLTMSSFGISVTGEYTLDGNQITLVLFGESDVGTYAIEGDTLTLTDASGQSITLKRAQ